MSEEVGKNVILTNKGEIMDINYVSIGTDWSTDAYWRIPKGDQYYGCPGKGWVGHKGSCYLVVQEERDWNGANDYCHKEVAELATIKDENEQSFLFSQLPQGSYCFNKFHNNTMCDKWAEYGECERNPVWMATNCHLACKHCMHNCRDIHKSFKCLEWAKQGECARNPKWMLKNCAMSCGVCQGAPTRGYWIGLQSTGMDQSYRWSDHSEVTYTNWNTHQPLWFNLRPRSCVAMFVQNGQWNDGQCSDPLPGFICKRSKMLLSITTQSPFKEGCSMENGYGYGVYCYVYVKEQKSWVDAQKKCVSQGGTLAFVGDAYIQAFVASELQNQLQDYWIGLSVTNGNWSWDGYQIDDIRRTLLHLDRNVKVDEVTGGCFAMSAKKPIGLWKIHTNCSSELPSVCQVPRPGFTTTTPPTTVSSTEPLPPCEDTWQSYGQYCYKVSDEKQQWHVAREICIHYGGAMVTINDADENNAIARMIDEESWLGLHDTESEGVFVWEDGSPTLYTFWYRNEPNNAGAGEDCAAISPGDGYWNDLTCYIAKRYICKIPRGKSVNKDPPMINTFKACDESSPDDGWKVFGDYCYYLGNDEMLTWHDANANCLSKGSNLASVHSEEENRFLLSMVAHESDVCWIGFNDLDLDNRFSWSDESVVDFTSWASGQPNDIYGEKCVPIVFDGSWHDYPCNDRKPYICMKRKDAGTMTTMTPTKVVINGGCPEGFNHTFGNKCFYFNYDDKTYRDHAKDQCETIRGHLPSIHSENEKDFIALHVNGVSTSVWLGMQDLDTDGHFDWTDNSPLDYSNWAPNEPSSNHYDAYAHEPCVEMWTNGDNLGLWNDVKCSVSRGFLCSTFKDPSIPILSVCPDGYVLLKQICYMLITATQSWNQSLQSCSIDGAQMISIANPVDFLVLKVLLGSVDLTTEVWVGGTLNDNNLQWNDGSSPTVPARTSIPTGCLYSRNNILSSAECSENRVVICKIDNSISTTSSTTVVTTVTDPYTYTCRDKSWILYKNNCYTTVLELTSFPYTKCSDYGMALASINSADEEYNITTQILQRYSSERYHGHYPYFWIGLTLLTGNEPGDTWTDGSKLVYSNFDNDDRNKRQGCVYMVLYTQQWRVGSCMDKHFYICKGPADIAMVPSSTSQAENSTVSSTLTTTQFKLPHIHRSSKMDRVADDSGLTGGQIAGIIIGVIGLLVIIGSVVYIIKSWTFKKPPYNFASPSLGFDNALFHKNQENVDIN
ncbi:macrophage mannose receptor 1-like [Ruditapes philippinarum]|uniref:macrophage mannose receptor 1-like n=1 Tax=Ruditapes philippinarum TaxID=129788 RepID=UPI00295AC7A0|nr:macrophage mannose receptor 1-like [Ruditapes philippinarum]